MDTLFTHSTLGSVAEIQTGPFGSQLHAADYVFTGIPSIMPNSIGARLNVLEEKTEKITVTDAQRLNKYLVEPNDIIYSRRGDVEKCAFITSKENGWLCGTGCLRVRFTSKQICPQFCAYYLSTDEIKGWVSGNAVGTTMPNLNTQILQRLPLALPPLAEQQAIAAILSSLDDKIDLLHRQNKTLEALAQTLFRQWFVEEADEGAGELSIGDIAVHSKIGVNPNADMGKSFFHYSIPAYDNGQEPTLESGGSIMSNKYRVVKNSILVSKLNPRTPRIWPVRALSSQDSICSTEFQVVVPKEDVFFEFLYCLLCSKEAQESLMMAASGTSGSHQRVKPEDIFAISVKSQSKDQISLFSQQVKPYFDRKFSNQNQIRTLTKLRDTLLPKLMSGEVRVEM